MRQIEKDMLAAIHACAPDWKQANTRVQCDAHGCIVVLHGHIIAKLCHADGWKFNLCGWNTPTTRSRLNALGANVSSKAGLPHVRGRAIPCDEWFTA